MTEPLPRPPQTMRRVNDLILTAEGLVVGGREEPVPFFCECDDPDCWRPVWLSPEDYTDATRDPRWTAVAPDHEVLDPGAAQEPLALDGVGWWQ